MSKPRKFPGMASSTRRRSRCHLWQLCGLKVRRERLLPSMIDWPEVRRRFPVTERFAYLNSAAAGPVSVASQAAAAGYYEKMMRDGDVHWNRWLADREAVRQKIATFINAEPEEIALTNNTSQGMNVIVDALEGRGEVISSELEFPVTTLPWMHRRIPVHRLA